MSEDFFLHWTPRLASVGSGSSGDREGEQRHRFPAAWGGPPLRGQGGGGGEMGKGFQHGEDIPFD